MPLTETTGGPDLHFEPLYTLSGFLVGLLVGLTGMAGGSLMTPVLMLVFGVQPATAVGTDLLYASATKTAGTLVHGLNRNIDWAIVGRLAAGSLPATVATVAALSLIGRSGREIGTLISVVLGVMLLLTALSLIFRRRFLAVIGPRLDGLSPWRVTGLTISVGAIMGVVVTISSVGAGALGVTSLVLMYPRLPMSRIVGSDIAHAVPLTFVAGFGHWVLGSVDWVLLSTLLTGSVPGILLGSHLAARVPDYVLRPVMAATLLLVGGRLLV